MMKLKNILIITTFAILLFFGACQSNDQTDAIPILTELPTENPTEIPAKISSTVDDISISLSKESIVYDDLIIPLSKESISIDERGAKIIVSIDRNGYTGPIEIDFSREDTTIIECEWESKDDTKAELLISPLKKGETSLKIYVHGASNYKMINIKSLTDIKINATATPKPTNSLTPIPTSTNFKYTFTEFAKSMYAKADVNVRNMPAKEGSKVGTLSEGQLIEVTGQCKETNWYRIIYKGVEAYVSGNYLIEKMPTTTPNPTKIPESMLEDENIYDTLMSVEYYMSYVSIYKDILDTNCELVENAATIDKKLTYCEDVMDSMYEISGYLAKVVSVCIEYEELKWFCESCVIDVPLFIENVSSYIIDAQYYSIQVSRAIDTYSAYCDLYDGEEMATSTNTSKPTIEDLVIVPSEDVVTVEEEPKTIYITVIDNGYEKYSIGYAYENTGLLSCQWGEWDGDTIPLTITTTRSGETTIRITIKDSSVYKDIKIISVKP